MHSIIKAIIKGERKKKTMKSSFHFMYNIASLCETQIQRNIKSKTQHRLFPTQKVVKTQQNHKIPPDSLSERSICNNKSF